MMRGGRWVACPHWDVYEDVRLRVLSQLMAVRQLSCPYGTMIQLHGRPGPVRGNLLPAFARGYGGTGGTKLEVLI